jgi:hypothetical protein
VRIKDLSSLICLPFIGFELTHMSVENDQQPEGMYVCLFGGV